jgi:hypothetical protein
MLTGVAPYPERIDGALAAKPQGISSEKRFLGSDPFDAAAAIRAAS